MNFRILFPLLAVSLLAAAPGPLLGLEVSRELPITADQAESAIKAAEAVRKRAAAAGNEWLQTGSLLEEAREAVSNEQWQRALERAQHATRQSELAIEQAERESTAWRERVVR